MPIASSTKTVQNVIDAVTRQFGDESGAQITQTDILRWINEGQLEIARQNKYEKTTATTTSVAGTSQYSLPAVSIIGIEAVFYNGVPLDFRSFAEVQELLLKVSDPTDPTANSTPRLWYEYSDSIFLYPIPKNSGDTIVVYCSVVPPQVTGTTDLLSIPDIYFKALQDYIMAQAYELDDDMNSSRIKAAAATATLDVIEQDFGSERFYPVITVMDEDAF